MDVTCNRCGTSYEFEEGLVSNTGTTVKCTQCGHLFKVHRGGEAPSVGSSGSPAHAPSEAPAGSRWRVRRIDGSLHTLESLAELTRLIAVGQFRPDDELSRTGQVWKRLGEIQELASLFDGGRGGRTSDPPPLPTLPPPPPGASERRSVEPRPGAPPPRSRRSTSPDRFEVMGTAMAIETEASEAPQSSARPQAVTPAPAPMRTSSPALGSAPAPRIASMSAAATTTREAQPAPQPPAFAPPLSAAALDAALDAPAPPRSRLWLWVVLVAAAVAGAGGAVTQILGRLDRAEATTSTITALVAQADAALAAHRDARFEEAIALYRKALPQAPDDAHLLSSLSRAYAQYSQALRTHAEIRQLLRAPLGLPVELVEDPEAVRLANEAKLYGQRGAQRNPGNEEAGVALSDALRLSGNLVAARAEIDRVRATQRVPDAERLRVEALLAIDEAHGRVSAGRKLAAMAVAYDPRSLAARLLLTRCLAHDGDFEGSSAQLAAIRELDATLPALTDHEAELAVLRSRPATARNVPALAPKVPSPATTATQPAAPAPSAPPAITPKPEPPSASGESEGGAAFTEAADLARKGERLLESGSVSAAKDAFEAALAKVPNLPRARTGLGYVHLERGQVTAALGQFKSAAAAGHPDATIGLGDTYRRLGRLDDALRTYKSYLKRFPQGPRRSIAEHQVELLQEQLGKAPSSP